MWTDITVFTDATYINIGIFTINKKYMFDPLLFLVFPIWTQCIYQEELMTLLERIQEGVNEISD